MTYLRTAADRQSPATDPRVLAAAISDDLATARAETEQARSLATWLRSGVIEAHEYRHPTQRKRRIGVRVVDEKRPGRTPA